MGRALYGIAATSFVVGFFAFTWARGCLHRGKRILDDREEELPGGKLEYSKLAGADPQLARYYRIAMAIWLLSSVLCAVSVIMAVLQ